MNPNDQLVTVRCPYCNHRTIDDKLQLAQRLRQIGMLKRDTSPSWSFMRALLESAAKTMACEQCLKTGLIVTTLDSGSDEDWGQARKCLGCQQAISAERLEVFPNSELCPACQTREENGEAVGTDVDYCSRCGDVLTVKRASGSGVARYVIRCPSCGMK